MASSIKKRTGSEYSDGRPGRVNYHSEDEYRTITLLVQSTAYDMQDVAHLRDSINELFDGELLLREMRIKSVEVEYESLGQRTGELQLEAPEYVNGKQIKVTMVNSPEIDDSTIRSTFTVEFETTELPYFETIYTTLELHDSGYSAMVEKYGLVDNIDDEKVKYRFTPSKKRVSLSGNAYERGMIAAANGSNASNSSGIRLTGSIAVHKGFEYTFIDSGNNADVDRWWIMEYDSSGAFIGAMSTGASVDMKSVAFVANGNSIRFFAQAKTGAILNLSDIGVNILPNMDVPEESMNFTVYNAGNVTIEPESMYLNIGMRYATTAGGLKIRNETTGEEHVINSAHERRILRINGMIVTSGTINNFRNTNRRFISLVPGDNKFTVSGGTFEEIEIDFKYLYK